MTGSGTVLDPYIIWDVNDLQDMSLDLTAYYELGQDIDATATTTWNWNAGRGVFEGFQPLGNFTGRFNGRYHNIVGLYMNRYALNATLYTALFTSLSTPATVQNVRILNLDLTSRVDTNLASNHACAGLVGTMGGGPVTVRRVFTTGTVTLTSNGTAAVFPSCNGAGIVGICYDSQCTFDECCSYVNITAHSVANAMGHSGGFVGFLYGDLRQTYIRNCFARGSVAVTHGGTIIVYDAGFAGVYQPIQANKLYLQQAYATGAISTTVPAGFDRDKGLANGLSMGCIGVTACFFDMDTTGQDASGCGTGRNTPAMKTLANYTAAGWNFTTIWAIDPAYNDGYPYLQWQRPTITVVSPNGGEIWFTGDTHNILWNRYLDEGPNVAIRLLKGGVLDEVLIASTPIGAPGGGVYSWAINTGKTPAADYKIEVISDTGLDDSSDNDFTLKAPAAPSPMPLVATLPATGVG